MISGTPASSGIVIGKASVLNKQEMKIQENKIQDVEKEKQKFLDTLLRAKNQLKEIKYEAEKNLGRNNAAIFDAHILILEDEELISTVCNKIMNEKVNAEFALKSTIDMYMSLFEEMDDEYMRERAVDIKDVSDRILRILMNLEAVNLNTDGEFIIVARDLTPSDTASINKKAVLGFITQIGGKTSHSVIMARSLEIPAIVGVGPDIDFINNGDLLIMDGDKGEILINPDQETINEYNKKKKALDEYRHEFEILKNDMSISLDGRKVEIVANIGSVEDVKGVISNGAEGVGLFRTEFLYMSKNSLPDEEEQFEAYKSVLEKMERKPVVIRTLDIGGDKKLSYLPIEEEMNPFLGYRAIRLCLDKKWIFKTQLRALLRASIYGNLKIMFPMVSCLEELIEAKSVFEEVKSNLIDENISFSNEIEIGIMIEIPSAAIISDILAKEVDFFSIGTNDLIQYTIAVDRMNEKVSYLYDPYNIAFLRLIKLVINNAHANNKWVGMCGEVAGDMNLIPILFGLGLDEFSMASSLILKARKLIKSIYYGDCKELVNEVYNLNSCNEIKEYIKQFKYKNV